MITKMARLVNILNNPTLFCTLLVIYSHNTLTCLEPQMASVCSGKHSEHAWYCRKLNSL